MTTNRRTALALILVLLSALWARPAAAQDDEMAGLKQRFQERYPKLLELRNAGKIGESLEGLTELVDERFKNEKINPADEKSPTIAEFLKLENEDRDKLYKRIAKDQKETPAEVAKQNAIRNYKNASPEHFLRKTNKEGKLIWVKKKDFDSNA